MLDDNEAWVVSVGVALVFLFFGAMMGHTITSEPRDIKLNFTNTMLDNCNKENTRNYWNADNCRAELEMCKVNLAYSNGELWALKNAGGE